MKILYLLFCVCVHNGFGAPAGSVASENITFVLSAESLQCQDVAGIYSQPDAFVSIYSYLKSPGSGLFQGEPKPFGSTSTIRNDNNPEWSDKFSYIWRNGTGQTLLFWVFDHDLVSPNDPIGVAEVSVDHFMESGGSMKLKLSGKAGSLIITRFPYLKRRIVPIAFKLSAENLPPRDRFWGYQGQSDPYAIITYQKGKNGRVNTLQQTGIFTDKANPTWPRPIEFREYEPNTNQTLSFDFYDRDLFSEDEFLGSFIINADELYESTGKVIRPLRNSEGNAKIILEIFPLYQPPHPTTTTESELRFPTTTTTEAPSVPRTSTTSAGTTRFSTTSPNPKLIVTENSEYNDLDYYDSDYEHLQA